MRQCSTWGFTRKAQGGKRRVCGAENKANITLKLAKKKFNALDESKETKLKINHVSGPPRVLMG